MPTLQSRPLPGIRFQREAPPPVDVLPRMDVPAFVGFACSGPLHTPVAIDEAARFNELFGPEPELAWDDDRGAPVTGLLAGTVRTYFGNGGRRCWVVRVAGQGAEAAAFHVPGLAQADPDGGLRPAVLVARSEGAWADTLAVGAELEATPVPLDAAAPVDAAFDLPGGTVPPERGELLRVAFPDGELFLGVVDHAEASAGPTGGARVVCGDVRWLWARPPDPGQEGTAWLDTDDGRRVSVPATAVTGGDGRVRVAVALPAGVSPAPGGMLAATFGTRHWCVTVVDTRPSGAPGLGPGPALAIEGPAVEVLAGPPEPLPAVPASLMAERLSLTLAAGHGGRWARLRGLGFAPAHPRYVGGLPDDEMLFAPSDHPGAADEHRDGLRRDAAEPRFPLAGIREVAGVFLPIGMGSVAGSALGARRHDRSPAARGGLVAFDAGHFLDEGLRTGGDTATSASVTTLLSRADVIRYAATVPRRLRGIHSVLEVDEVTLVAVPDASQRGWSEQDRPRRSPAAVDVATPTEDTGDFGGCTREFPPTPRLTATAPDPAGTFTLRWEPAADGPTTAVVEEAADAGFDDPVTIFSGADDRSHVRERGRGTYHYRARLVTRGITGAWSETVTVAVDPAPRRVVVPAGDYDDGALLSVHRALLRMCGARGDLVALLSVPEHYREAATAAHRGRIGNGETSPEMEASLGAGEEHALGYGALFHPWVLVPSGSPGDLLALPPDGPVAGVAARRALQHGAWVAPANEPLAGVVALSPRLPAEAIGALHDAQVNALRDDPAGFLWLAAMTLGDDPLLRPLNVRRLLALLRRLAVRRGNEFVFEPNDPALHRRVARGLEAVLERLFALGAFSGERPEQAFRVAVTGVPDLGRMTVELRVAPSRPLEFLTVRLRQGAEGGLQLAGVLA